MEDKGKYRQISDAEIVKALEFTKGNVYLAAKKISCAGATIYKRLRENPELNERFKEIRETQLDEAELQLINAVKAGKPWAIQFQLKTLGKARGYGDHLDISGSMAIQPVDLSKLSTDELRQLESLLGKASDVPE